MAQKQALDAAPNRDASNCDVFATGQAPPARRLKAISVSNHVFRAMNGCDEA
jgi:hypothetical protein